MSNSNELAKLNFGAPKKVEVPNVQVPAASIKTTPAFVPPAPPPQRGEGEATRGLVGVTVATPTPSPSPASVVPPASSKPPLDGEKKVIPSVNVTSITLSDEQMQAVDAIREWFMKSPNQEYRLGGYAGTGKTTLIKHLLAEGHKKGTDIIVCAFTGKAVNVLQRKGVPAATIHSTIYKVHVENGVYHFEKRLYLGETRDMGPDLIIIDEASMISTDLYRDLKSFGHKMLFVGDPGQLEPVGDNPNLMAKPDYVLRTIHRQAAESNIIKLANSVRMGGPIIHGVSRSDLVIRPKTATYEDILAANQVLCAKNATRQRLNRKFREQSGYPLKCPTAGEKIIVLQNNPSLGVFNGTILFIERVTETSYSTYIGLDCVDELGTKFPRLKLWTPEWFHETGEFSPAKVKGAESKAVKVPKGMIYADFAYVITCHKSQGSEWDKVLVIDEWMPPNIWDMKRWRYTAITRAAKHLTYCI